MTMPQTIHIDMSRALNWANMTADEVTSAIHGLLDEYCPPSGGLAKFGSCQNDLLDTRPFDAWQYSPEYFDRNKAWCVMFNIPD